MKQRTRKYIRTNNSLIIVIPVIQILLVFMYVLHLIAFLLTWLAIANIHNGESWYFVSQKIIDDYPTSPLYSLYITSFYFGCTTLTTIGYGDFKPISINDKLIFVVLFVAGILFYTMIFGEIT